MNRRGFIAYLDVPNFITMTTDNEEEKSSRPKKTDAYESRCFGLVGGVALLADLKTLVNAGYVRKSDGPFYCRACLSEAIVRKCSDKEDHFAHKALVTPTGQNKDTAFHHGVRDELFGILKERFPLGNWKTEVKIVDESLGTFIPDIAGYFGERNKAFPAVAVEVQLSPYSPSYIRKKTTFYAKKNIHVLWVVPLTRPLEKAVFRPRRYELYLHSMYLGYVFYYEPDKNGLLTPVHYGPAMRYIEPKTFFDENAEEQHVGNFYLKYKTLKEPKTGDEVFLADAVAKISGAWENPNNKRLNLPERKIMVTPQKRWWEKDENKQWLKENDWVAYARKYLPQYEPDDDYMGEEAEDEQ